MGEPQRLTPAALDASYPTWMPGSKEILFSARGSLWRLVVARRKHAGATAFRRRGRHDAGGFALPARAAASSGLRSQFPGLQYLARRDLCSRRAGLLAACRLYLLHETGLHPQLSPDGRRVAFASDRSGEWEIWLADPDGSNAVQLTSMGAQLQAAPAGLPTANGLCSTPIPKGSRTSM